MTTPDVDKGQPDRLGRSPAEASRLYTHTLCLSVCLSVSLSLCLSLCLSLSLSLSLSPSLSLSLFSFSSLSQPLVFFRATDWHGLGRVH